jgi:hypothetical protein
MSSTIPRAQVLDHKREPIAQVLPKTYRLTLVARYTGTEFKDADIVVTDDDLKAASEAIIRRDESTSRQPPRTARKNQVILRADNRKYVARDDRELTEGETVIADTPHEDGDYSYMCNSSYCRCSD